MDDWEEKLRNGSNLLTRQFTSTEEMTKAGPRPVWMEEEFVGPLKGS
jgi:hypothetical protein